MTTLFILSLLALCIQLLLKFLEVRVKKLNLISRMSENGDLKIHRFIGVVVSKYFLYKKIVSLFLFDFLPSYAYEVLVHLKDYVAKKYYSAGDGLRGRRVLRNNGSVSFFLQKISEKKPSTQNHIENFKIH